MRPVPPYSVNQRYYNMLLMTKSDSAIRRRSFDKVRTADCFRPDNNKTTMDWAIELLQLEPYQHILEIGFGSGRTLQTLGRKLQIGFLAGVDRSPENYLMALKRNRRLIEQQILQLHLGTVSELPYPAGYFHTLFSNHSLDFLHECPDSMHHLHSLLRSQGRLVQVFQPKWAPSDADLWKVAEQVQKKFSESGLSAVQISFLEMHPVNAFAVVGFKP